jgi:tRNA (adenine58-N1)-methyltransferase non-catalytic subunit
VDLSRGFIQVVDIRHADRSSRNHSVSIVPLVSSFVEEYCRVAAKNNMATTTDPPRDPLLRNRERSSIVNEGDWVILKFADEKKTLCLKASTLTVSSNGRPAIKCAKTKCSTKALVGLQYGRVVEQTKYGFVPFDLSEKLIPDLEIPASSTAPVSVSTTAGGGENSEDPEVAEEQDRPNPRDNSSLVDSKTNQHLAQADLEHLKRTERDKRKIVTSIVENSKTFDQKTIFSQEKYVRKKQKKYLSRCRIVRCTARTMCQYLHQKDPKRIYNLRDDTLAQLLAYANISAGCQTLIVETCLGLVTGAVAERLAGYGRILSVYDGVQPKYREQLDKFNFSFIDMSTVHWVHAGDVFGNERNNDDAELQEREAMVWPCYLQPHTRHFVQTEMTKNNDDSATKTPFDLDEFMYKRANRFLRKLCRSTPIEARQYLDERLCDSIILACHYDPIQTLLPLLPFLAPSCPFVVYCEFLEPLVQCFQRLQDDKVAINLRLCDTWMREYQVLEGRTHPFMQMSQNGGYILTGVRLHGTTGHNELDDKVLETAKTKWRKMKRSQGVRRSGTPRPTGKKEI